MRHLPTNQKGVAAVEFGLLLIPLITLAFGITEYGRAMYQYNTIAKATRDAARYLSTKTPGDSAAWTAAKNLVVCGQTVCVKPGKPPAPDIPLDPLVPKLTAAMVVIKDSLSDKDTHSLQQIPDKDDSKPPTLPPSGVANLVTVEVSGFQFESLVSFVVPNITFSPISTTMFGPPPS